MATLRTKRKKLHDFKNKLLLNQWMLSLFGIDPLTTAHVGGREVRPFHVLAGALRHSPEGLDNANLHYFYHSLNNSELFQSDTAILTSKDLLRYEENIARHTLAINRKRDRPVTWKYYQWLTLLFVEIYLDRLFSDPDSLLEDLNIYLTSFNKRWSEFEEIPAFELQDLNKICLQNATGSGKTLLMHINLMQYRHYAELNGKDKELSRVVLLTPNESLSEQHLREFAYSGISANRFLSARGSLFGVSRSTEHVDVIEITNLAEYEGPSTVATRSLGDQNLLLVDEGHRGMSGKEQGVWFSNRSALAARGFTFEYSATFEQAVGASGNKFLEDKYAKSILFDYSYKWFYEDGFGKDYQILNIPKSSEDTLNVYLTACLLKFYQQLRIYGDNEAPMRSFNIEKPLWVFVGSTVSSTKIRTKEDLMVATDVASVVQFLALFLEDRARYIKVLEIILEGTGRDSGLLDDNGNDIFANSFQYLNRLMVEGETAESLYGDILKRIFQSAGNGILTLERVKGNRGEISLRVGGAFAPFGLINVGDSKALCDHLLEISDQNRFPLAITETDFQGMLFESLNNDDSSINLLIGSKKFIEGWDSWRVSTMGLMHVGRSEGAQIVQLFGRGVRLKGYQWSLKRSGHSTATILPPYIEELETLNIFGIQADFMAKFRDYLRDEGLPGNESRMKVEVPIEFNEYSSLNLKIVRSKHKHGNQGEYDFKTEAAIPFIGDIPTYIMDNPVVSDWYPRITTLYSQSYENRSLRDEATLDLSYLRLLNMDRLFFELEQYKAERGWHNLNITKAGIKSLLSDKRWYRLLIPKNRLTPSTLEGLRLLQQIVLELLKSYCEKLYNYRKREYLEPRLEIQKLSSTDDNIPQRESYTLVVDSDSEQAVQNVLRLKSEITQSPSLQVDIGNVGAVNFHRHLFRPLFHVRQGGNVTVLPMSLTESEYTFVSDFRLWCHRKEAVLSDNQMQIALLRNMSRGKGTGFFEAANFHPDFIFWLLHGNVQYVNFIEPHGLVHEGPSSEKINFHTRIKSIETRLDDESTILNSFILSWTPYERLKWGLTRPQLENRNVLFMRDEDYLDKMILRIVPALNDVVL